MTIIIKTHKITVPIFHTFPNIPPITCPIRKEHNIKIKKLNIKSIIIHLSKSFRQPKNPTTVKNNNSPNKWQIVAYISNKEWREPFRIRVAIKNRVMTIN